MVAAFIEDPEGCLGYESCVEVCEELSAGTNFITHGLSIGTANCQRPIT